MAHDTGSAFEVDHVLLQLDPHMQQRIRALDLDMDLDLLEIALDVELGLRARAPELEVALEIVVPGPVLITAEQIARAAIDRRRAVAMISPAPVTLDDEWFGRYDENDPGTHPSDHTPEEGTGRRLVQWLRRRTKRTATSF